MKSKKVETLEQENQKLKKLNRIFLIIIIMGFLLVITAGILYLHKA